MVQNISKTNVKLDGNNVTFDFVFENTDSRDYIIHQ